MKINTIADLEEAYNNVLEENKRLELINRELLEKCEEHELSLKKYKMMIKDANKTLYILEQDYNELEKKYNEVKERSDKFTPLKRQISDDQVQEIKDLRADGKTFKEIRVKTGWSNVTIARVLKGVYDV